MDKRALIKQVVADLEAKKQAEIAHHHDLIAKTTSGEMQLLTLHALERVLDDLNGQIANLQRVGFDL